MSNGGLIQIHHHTNLDVLEKFTFKDGELYFDGIIVSREYTSEEIQAMIEELWIDIEDFLNPTPEEVLPDTGDDTETEVPETPEEGTDVEAGGESGDTEESEGSNVPEQSQAT